MELALVPLILRSLLYRKSSNKRLPTFFKNGFLTKFNAHVGHVNLLKTRLLRRFAGSMTIISGLPVIREELGSGGPNRGSLRLCRLHTTNLLLAGRPGDCAPIDIREARTKGGGCMLAAVLKIANCLQPSNIVSWIYCLKLSRIPCAAQTNVYTVSTGSSLCSVALPLQG